MCEHHVRGGGRRAIWPILPFLSLPLVELLRTLLGVSLAAVLSATALSVVFLVGAAIAKTFLHAGGQWASSEFPKVPRQRDEVAEKRITEKELALAERLAGAIRFPTISFDADADQPSDDAAMCGFHNYIAMCFPLVHKHLERHIVNKLSLIYVWRGMEDDDGSVLPYLFAAHMDVVPTPDREKWTVDPFAGKIKDGYVWGRGAIDDKHAVMGILEAVEDLLQDGFRPKRSLYIALGHDEEVGGKAGARHMAAWFEERKLRFQYILDEAIVTASALTVDFPAMALALFFGAGSLHPHGGNPGLSRPVALVCTAEKGAMTLKLSAEAQAGHSSAPPATQAIAVLGRAVSNLVARPHRPHMAYGDLLLEALAAHLSFPMRVVASNLWLFGPIVHRVLLSIPALGPTLRTTTAVTVFNSGVKRNVLPGTATAIVNHRIHPFDTEEDVLRHDRHAIGDSRVKMEVCGPVTAPSPVTDQRSPPFRLVREALGEVFPDALVAPSLMVGNTDTKWYWNLTDAILRFTPTCMHAKDVKMFHGIDERISTANYAKMVLWYRTLVKLSDLCRT